MTQRNNILNAAIITYALFLFQFQAALSFTLITFDVDGTLVQGSGDATVKSAHAQSYSYAVSKILNEGKPVPPVSDALPRELYHGSTDGLILLRLARASSLLLPPLEEEEQELKYQQQLEDMFECMYNFVNGMTDEEIAYHISPLPGVMDQLRMLSTMKERVMCGLVTGNVEGIARRKMKAVGIYDTNALNPPCPSQKKWEGAEHLGFLGGFGSDYCSGNIHDLRYNHLDRGEQIAIAARRCQNILARQNSNDCNMGLKRVVHVGDAPADVLAAKWFSEQQLQLQEEQPQDDAIRADPTQSKALCVGMVAVATGSYSADELRQVAGETIPGRWEPVVLERGMDDPYFLQACGL